MYPGSHAQRNPPSGRLIQRPCSPQTGDGIRTAPPNEELEGAGTVHESTTRNKQTKKIMLIMHDL